MALFVLNVVVYFFFIFTDIIGPSIFLEDEYPLTRGENSILKCSVISILNIQLHWDCLNFTSQQAKEENDTLTTELFVSLKATYNGERCSCIARYNNFTASTFTTLNISSKSMHKNIILRNVICALLISK